MLNANPASEQPASGRPASGRPESGRPESDDLAVERIAQSGARGALALVVIATAVVIGTWLAFYVFVFLPRTAAP